MTIKEIEQQVKEKVEAAEAKVVNLQQLHDINETLRAQASRVIAGSNPRSQFRGIGDFMLAQADEVQAALNEAELLAEKNRVAFKADRDHAREERDTLLAACKAFLTKPDSDEAVDVNRDYTDTDAAIDQIRAAIAKAEGR